MGEPPMSLKAPDPLETYVHRYLPPSAGDRRTLLLLHGTGGDENDLVPVGQMLAPTAGMLSPRGNVSERGAARFFRRVAEGVFDEADLRVRTGELVAFIDAAAERYGFDHARVVAVGFSNGANIAASVLLSHPSALRAAALVRPMVPYAPEQSLSLAGVDVFIGAGRADPIATSAHAELLAELLRERGAEVKLAWQPAGHMLTRGDLSAASDWLESLAISAVGEAGEES
jgi:predicted esterase